MKYKLFCFHPITLLHGVEGAFSQVQFTYSAKTASDIPTCPPPKRSQSLLLLCVSMVLCSWNQQTSHPITVHMSSWCSSLSPWLFERSSFYSYFTHSPWYMAHKKTSTSVYEINHSHYRMPKIHLPWMSYQIIEGSRSRKVQMGPTYLGRIFASSSDLGKNGTLG